MQCCSLILRRTAIPSFLYMMILLKRIVFAEVLTSHICSSAFSKWNISWVLLVILNIFKLPKDYLGFWAIRLFRTWLSFVPNIVSIEIFLCRFLRAHLVGCVRPISSLLWPSSLFRNVHILANRLTTSIRREPYLHVKNLYVFKSNGWAGQHHLFPLLFGQKNQWSRCKNISCSTNGSRYFSLQRKDEKYDIT